MPPGQASVAPTLRSMPSGHAFVAPALRSMPSGQDFGTPTPNHYLTLFPASHRTYSYLYTMYKRVTLVYGLAQLFFVEQLFSDFEHIM
jgi:hypothetical protein